MQAALRRHDAILRSAIESHGGYVFKTIGDAFCAAFSTVGEAISAALDAQRRIAGEDWTGVNGLRVRMAIHAGQTDERDGDYFGPAMNRVARMLSVGHGGQVLVSGIAADLAEPALHDGVSLRSLGSLPLKNLRVPENVFQLVAPGLETDFKPLREIQPPPNNLPVQATSFFGRQADLARVEELLKSSRLVTIAGTGGSGKTRLALEAARNLIGDHRDGAWFVDLAPISDPTLTGSAILSALGVDQTGNEASIDVLIAFAKNRDLLLILDNCEHVVDEVARILAALLAKAPSVTTLVTSREVMNISGERVHRLGSLDDAAAVALFADRARNVNASFELDDTTTPIVEDICRRVDGIALAIELAASRLRALSLPDLSKKLELRILAGGGRERQPRQQTMRALIDWGYDVLTDDEKRVFRQLSVFAGGFTLEAATGICGDGRFDEIALMDTLTGLVDKSLIALETNDSGRRFRLLELIRQYAREKLDESGKTEYTRSRHAQTFAALSDACYEEWDTDPRHDWLLHYAKELDNFRSALQWTLVDGQDSILGARIAGGAGLILMRLSLLREAIEWCNRALSKGTFGDGSAEARVNYVLSMLYNNQGLESLILPAARRARDVSRLSGDSRVLVRALSQIAAQYPRTGTVEEATASADEAIALADEVNDRRLVAATLMRCARVREAQDVGSMRDRFMRSVSLFKSLGRDEDTSRALFWWAQAEAELSEYDRAAEIGLEALKISHSKFVIYVSIAGYYLALEDLDRAEPMIREALILAKDDERPVLNAFATGYIASIYGLRNSVEAAKLFGFSEAVFAALNWTKEGYDIALFEELRARLSSVLGEEQLNRLMTEGAAWSQRQALYHARRL
jgi:predicted ATPase